MLRVCAEVRIVAQQTLEPQNEIAQQILCHAQTSKHTEIV